MAATSLASAIVSNTGREVQIDTQNIRIRATKSSDNRFAVQLFKNQMAINDYLNCMPRDDGWISQKIQEWQDKWTQNNPLSSYVIEKKDPTMAKESTRIGYLLFEETSSPGTLGLSLILMNKQPADIEEIARAVNTYVMHLVQQGEIFIQGTRLCAIEASAAKTGSQFDFVTALGMSKQDIQDAHHHDYYELQLVTEVPN